MPLKPSGQTPTSSPRGQQPLGVGVARQRRAALAGQLGRRTASEHEVGAEHPQVPVRRVVVVQRELGHQRVDRRWCPSGWRRRARRPRSGMFSMPAHLDPEPLPVERPQRGQQHVLGELGVEAELVDLVVAGEPPAQERQRRRRPGAPSAGRGRPDRAAVRRGRARRPARRRAPAAVGAGAVGRAARARGAAPRAAHRPRRRQRTCRGPSARATAARRALRERQHAALVRTRPCRSPVSRVARGRRTKSSNASPACTSARSRSRPHPGRVDAPAVGQEAAPARARSPPVRRGGTPADQRPRGRRHRERRPAGPADRLRQHHHAVTGDVERAGRSATVARRSTSSASFSCTNCSRGSKPEHGGHHRQREVAGQRRCRSAGR